MFEHLRKQWAVVAADAAFLQTHQLADGQGFPPSYRAFATELGWGRLCGLWLIYVPLGPYPDSWLVQSPAIRRLMDAFYAAMEHDPLFVEPDGYAGLERRWCALLRVKTANTWRGTRPTETPRASCQFT